MRVEERGAHKREVPRRPVVINWERLLSMDDRGLSFLDPGYSKYATPPEKIGWRLFPGMFRATC